MGSHYRLSRRILSDPNCETVRKNDTCVILSDDTKYIINEFPLKLLLNETATKIYVALPTKTQVISVIRETANARNNSIMYVSHQELFYLVSQKVNEIRHDGTYDPWFCDVLYIVTTRIDLYYPRLITTIRDYYDYLCKILVEYPKSPKIVTLHTQNTLDILGIKEKEIHTDTGNMMEIDREILTLIRINPNMKRFEKFYQDDQIATSKNRLQNAGLLCSTRSYPTKKGIFCSMIPLNLTYSDLLYRILFTQKLSVNEITIHLMVLCTLQNYHYGIYATPPWNPDLEIILTREDIRKYHIDKYGGYSGVDTLYKIWIDIMSKINPVYLTDLKQYCRNNHLRFFTFREIITVYQKCHRRMVQEKIVSPYIKLTGCIMPDLSSLSTQFYQILQQTDLPIVSFDVEGKTLRGKSIEFSTSSIHLMDIDSHHRYPIYVLANKTHQYPLRGSVLVATVIHTLSPYCADSFDQSDESLWSIFSSDVDTESTFHSDIEDVFFLEDVHFSSDNGSDDD